MSYEKPDLSHLSDKLCRKLVEEICEAVWYGIDGWNPDNECEIAEVIYLLDRYQIKCTGDDDESKYVISAVTGERVYLDNEGRTVSYLHMPLGRTEVCRFGTEGFKTLIEDRLGVAFSEVHYDLDHVDMLGDLIVRVSGTVKR